MNSSSEFLPSHRHQLPVDRVVEKAIEGTINVDKQHSSKSVTLNVIRGLKARYEATVDQYGGLLRGTPASVQEWWDGLAPHEKLYVARITQRVGMAPGDDKEAYWASRVWNRSVSLDDMTKILDYYNEYILGES